MRGHSPLTAGIVSLGSVALSSQQEFFPALGFGRSPLTTGSVFPLSERPLFPHGSIVFALPRDHGAFLGIGRSLPSWQKLFLSGSAALPSRQDRFFPPSGPGALPSEKKRRFPLRAELCHLSLPSVFPCQQPRCFRPPPGALPSHSALRGPPHPSTREAAAFAVSLSLWRCRPGAAGPRSTGGLLSASSSAAAMAALAKASGALKSVDYEVFGRVQGNGGLRGAGGASAGWERPEGRRERPRLPSGTAKLVLCLVGFFLILRNCNYFPALRHSAPPGAQVLCPK